MITFTVDILITSFVSFLMITHYTIGWTNKQDDIFGSMNPKSANLYFGLFFNRDVPAAESMDRFRELYWEWYGRRYLIFPMILLVTISLANAQCLGDSATQNMMDSAGTAATHLGWSLPPTAVLSIAGAFAFVIWDIVKRVAKRNLAIPDILGACVRLALAVPLGYAFKSIVTPEVGAFVAFAVGAFPLETVQTLLQRLANRQLKLEMGADSANDQVTKLSGIDQPTADRIEEADVTTIAQLAYCDPVQLSMRTRLRFAYVSDIVAQALAWIYLGPCLDKLRVLGLRGAGEITSLHDLLVLPDDADELRRQLRDLSSALDGPGFAAFAEMVSRDGDRQRLRQDLEKLLSAERWRRLLKVLKTPLRHADPKALTVAYNAEADNREAFSSAVADWLSAALVTPLAQANALVDDAVAALNSGDKANNLVTRNGLLNAFRQIATDPYAVFIVATW